MEKGLARFRVSLLCFCCGCFIAAALLRLLCCCFVAAALLRCFVALRWQTAAGGPSHFVGPFPFREPMPPATVCHLSAAGTPTASWPSAQSGCQCRLRLSATSALPVLQPRSGPVPNRGANASCGCLPPQRRRYSNRVLAQCPVGLPMPPAAVCHLSAAGTPTASWFTALFGSQCFLRLSATSALRALQPRPGPVPSRAVNAFCGCLPPQRRGYSNAF